MKTRNQEIASDVFTRISAHKGKEKISEYKSMAEKLPVLVHTAGLAQALSFLETRDSKMAKQLLEDLSATLGCSDLSGDSRNTTNLQDYLHLTRQVQLALLWYKRFATSVLEA